MTDPVQLLLKRLEGVRRSGEGWTARCPGHEDRHASLSVAVGGDGRALLTCHAGCGTESIVEVVGLTMADLYAHPDEAAGRVRRPKRNTAQSTPVKPVTALPPADLTVADLCARKKLDPTGLAGRGVRDVRRNGVRMVEIPYRDADRVTVAIRFRDGTGFRWRSGDRVMLYGLDRLGDIRDAGWVLLVEGESDTWTAEAHGLPALGIPGKGTWRPEWRSQLEGLNVVLWQEPDAADLTERIARDLPGARVIVASADTKDISEAHIAGLDVRALVDGLRHKAPTAAELVTGRRAEAAESALPDIMRRAASALADPDPLALVEATVRELGYGGDVRPVVIVYLAATTRLLRHRNGATPVHVLLVGPPSAGKSYTLSAALALLPADAAHNMEAGSPRTLIYDDADLAHRVVVFPEADSLPAGEDNPAASAVRALLSEGRLAYKVTVRDPGTGDFTVREISKPGPTVLLTTAVRRLGPQLDSRLFVVEVPDEQGQLRAALRAQAALELSTAPVPAAVDSLVALQEMLGARAPWDVVVPFVDALAEAVGRNPLAPRITRDFARLVALVKATAVLRHRYRTTDAQGRIVAELADYDAVRALVADIYVGSQSGASERIRATVEAVAAIVSETGDAATVTGLAARIGINKMAASRRARAAVAAGYLINAEDRRGRPARLMPGELLPANDGLPTAAELGRNAVTPLTADDGIGTVTAGADVGPDLDLPANDDGWEQNEPTVTWEGFGWPLTPEAAA